MKIRKQRITKPSDKILTIEDLVIVTLVILFDLRSEFPHRPFDEPCFVFRLYWILNQRIGSLNCCSKQYR